MGEFAAPLRTLRSMHELFAGLNNQQLAEQIKQFKEEMDYILSQVTTDENHLRYVSENCKHLLYDGKFWLIIWNPPCFDSVVVCCWYMHSLLGSARVTQSGKYR